jgi:protein-S-isoprenylcysteine O-methyltransferase Ste14
MLLFFIFPHMMSVDWAAIGGLVSWLDAASTVLLPLAIIIFVWAISTLGMSYSMDFAIKEKQFLAQTGPYKFVRHPMYSSYFICFFALVLATQSIVLLILTPLFFHAFYSSAKTEEALLEKAFGASYRKYKERAGMFFPKFTRGEVQ